MGLGTYFMEWMLATWYFSEDLHCEVSYSFIIVVDNSFLYFSQLVFFYPLFRFKYNVQLFLQILFFHEVLLIINSKIWLEVSYHPILGPPVLVTISEDTWWPLIRNNLQICESDRLDSLLFNTNKKIACKVM
jgi:hypothetical protein